MGKHLLMLLSLPCSFSVYCDHMKGFKEDQEQTLDYFQLIESNNYRFGKSCKLEAAMNY